MRKLKRSAILYMAARCPKDEVVLDERFAAPLPGDRKRVTADERVAASQPHELADRGHKKSVAPIASAKVDMRDGGEQTG